MHVNRRTVSRDSHVVALGCLSQSIKRSRLLPIEQCFAKLKHFMR